MKLIIDIDVKIYRAVIEDNDMEIVGNNTIELGRAIANGTPVSNEGDLISRSELKKAIENYLEKRKDVIIWETDMLNMLDNAPTVELFCAYLSDGEVRQPCVESPCKHERPQGEWIDYDNTFYKCPDCGYLLEKCCPQCQNKVILPKGGAK